MLLPSGALGTLHLRADRVMADNTADGLTHRVLPGECADSIAALYGLPPAKVWDHPNNEKLRKVRSKRDELLPGDEVFVPAPQIKAEPATTETVSVFVMKRPMRVVRLKLVKNVAQPPVEPAMLPPNVFENTVQPPPVLEPWADAPVVVTADAFSWEGQADADGKVTFQVPLAYREAVLTIAPETADETKRQLQFGMMDPIEELTGITQRLSNLGYRVAPTSELTDQVANTVKEFQHAHGLTVTGEVDDETVAKLKSL